MNEMTNYKTEKDMKENIKRTSEQSNTDGWQKVTISGVSGILMGAAGMYAVNSPTKKSGDFEDSTNSSHSQSFVSENGLKVAKVDDSLSFGDAFVAARNSVGAGGVFHWRGNIYNTFLEEEWNNMSPQAKSQFAQQVQPVLLSDEMHSDSMHHDFHDETAQVHSYSNDETKHMNYNDYQGEAQQKNNEIEKPQQLQEDDDVPEVHFLGIEQRQTDDGHIINVGHMTIEDDNVALVDFDNDFVFDVAVSDSNHNNTIENDEVRDISEAQLTVTEFAVMTDAENGDVGAGEYEMVPTQQEQIAEDMPDYMNEADMQNV